MSTGHFLHPCAHWYRPFDSAGIDKKKNLLQKQERIFHGDPYGNRTHVTAVKGRCLNRLTNGPGSGNLIRTDDIPGMNRLLYQLSYAAMCGQMIPAPPKSASLLYPSKPCLSSKKSTFFGNTFDGGVWFEILEECGLFRFLLWS